MPIYLEILLPVPIIHSRPASHADDVVSVPVNFEVERAAVDSSSVSSICSTHDFSLLLNTTFKSLLNALSLLKPKETEVIRQKSKTSFERHGSQLNFSLVRVPHCIS
jgi:hypothetical protein